MFVIRCDYCDTEVESGPGSPGSVARRKVACGPCAAVVSAADEEIRRRGVERTARLAEQLEAEREELVRAGLPKESGGSGKGLSEWPRIEVPE